jgi:hypothetical protein
MAANLQPITSDGGFTSGGNINSSGDPSAAPSLNDFFSITSAANFAIVTDNANTDQTWTFDDAGNLTLPLGSIVYETNIPDGALSGSAIALKPIGGTTANQQLLIYPTAADGDHIHLTSGNLYATELFLGSDNLYVKLANTGNVVINSNDGNSSNAMWTFDTAGNVTIPGNIVGAATIAIDNRDSGNTADIQLYSANEILIQARDRTLGSGLPGGDIRINAGDSAEDGDTYAGAVYISAGTGGESNLDLGGDGGVISIGAGDGGDAIGASFTAGNGGDVTINAGDAGDNNDDIDLGATGGDVNIIAGMSSGNGIPGGSVYINSGRGDPDSEGGPDGNVEIQIGNNGSTWIFDSTGNLTLPGNTFDVNYANGTQVSIGGGGNTGNVTFDDVTVQGVNQLNLSAGADFTANLAYLQVRSGDVASHIHFDTGNNEAYDLIVGNDDKFVQVSSTGNIIMSSYDGNTSYTWTLDTTGNLILAGGNSVIQSIANSSSEPLYPNVSTMVFTPDALLSSQSLVLDPTGPSHIHLRAPSSNIDEPLANIFLGGEDSSFEVGYYNGAAPNLFVHSGGNTWTFDTTGILVFPRDTGPNTTDPILTITGGASPKILSEDASLAGPANLEITALNTIFTGSSGSAIKIYPDDGEVASDGNLQIWANSGGNTEYSWTFDTTGNLTTPSNLVIGPGPGSGSSIFQYNEGLQILGEGANSVVQLGWTANTSAPDSVTTIAMNYPGGGEGNILIAVGNNATTVNYWLFDNTGNLRLPGNTFAVNYANGTQVPVGVTQDITSNGAMSIMLYDGNIKYNNYATVEPSTGNIAGGNISTTGVVTANIANITTGNITTINSGLLQNGNSNITITSNGNVSIQAAGSNVELVVTSTGANVTGTLTSTGKIGYASGSSVTQLTSRGTGVTINTLAGTIITTSVAMAASEIDTFGVTNSAVDPNNDIVLAQIVSPNQGTYNCIANPAVIGGFNPGFFLNIVNISGFTTSDETITIRFMVIKAPNA